MTINYKGISNDFDSRIAEINFNDNEWDLICRMEKVFAIKGYDLKIVTDGYACCSVNDFDEYKAFAKEYKEVKRVIKNCIKFGF